jgi:3-oxoacyl-[acyl-carrier-protein] synthase III
VTNSAIGILGLGDRVPDQIRRNDDPIFDWLKKNVPDWDKLFYGYVERRILAPGESVLDILEPAARIAVDDAGRELSEIDVVVGCSVPGTFVAPADLFALTGRLGLRETTLTIPLGNDFSNFTTGVVLADALVRAGRARNVLVAAGAGYSRAVDYRTPQSVSAGDGAGAVVVGLATGNQSPRWTIVDQEVIAREQNFGQMYLAGDRRNLPEPSGPGDPSTPDPLSFDFSAPYFHITDDGVTSFTSFGAKTAPIAVQRVLARQQIPSSDVTLTGHQASMKLLEAWKEAIKPAAVFETVEMLANMTSASIAVNLSCMSGQVSTPYLVALTLAPDMHAHALLLRRGS